MDAGIGTHRRPPDLARVAEQHQGLVTALQEAGITVDVAPAPGRPYSKAIYTRDPLITTPQDAIIGRMGVRMRRGEEPDVSRFVASLGMPIVGTITGAGTLEGGSYCKLRPDLHLLGTSIRCNHEGASAAGAAGPDGRRAAHGADARLVDPYRPPPRGRGCGPGASNAGSSRPA